MAKMTQRAAERFALGKIGERGASFRPFLLGWTHGYQTSAHCSPREAAEHFKEWSTDQIERYLNGRDDGVAGDTTRVAMMAAEQ